MNIRTQIFGSSKPEEPLLRAKQPKGAHGDELDSVTVPRGESRRGNSRTADRHRLSEEAVRVSHDGVTVEAQLVNLSDGGAMIAGSLGVKLWDRVELHLGEGEAIECAVRWIRGDRIGLEFAHETRLNCSSDEVAALLREVINRSFPDAQFELDAGEDDPAAPADTASETEVEASSAFPGEHRRAPRHPLIWSGTLHLENQTISVRIRNISSTGALIDCFAAIEVGAEPLLELNDEASMACTVQWVVGRQVGVRFHREFDMQLLARSTPEVTRAPEWVKPDYLDGRAQERTESDPWDPRWERLTVREMNLELEATPNR